VDSKNEIREFLATRRAKITPQQVGLASHGRRRVPGLRREEVAVLAGVSTDYYAQLERGNLSGVSDSVLDAIARAPYTSTRPNTLICMTWRSPPTPHLARVAAPPPSNTLGPSGSASSTA
jgi:transcriptional regulator with XRE-family HTH domain